MVGPYKDFRLYGCIMLNYLILNLGAGLEPERLSPELLAQRLEEQPGTSKGALRQEIRSNNTMTHKVLDYLETQGFITLKREPEGYNIRVTLQGIRHARRYNRFYLELYSRQIEDHYRYRGSPAWVRAGED